MRIGRPAGFHATLPGAAFCRSFSFNNKGFRAVRGRNAGAHSAFKIGWKSARRAGRRVIPGDQNGRRDELAR